MFLIIAIYNRLMGNGILTIQDNETWKPRRQLYEPAFKKRLATACMHRVFMILSMSIIMLIPDMMHTLLNVQLPKNSTSSNQRRDK